MRRETLEQLACPHCRRPWRLWSVREDEHGIGLGQLLCGGCGIGVPILDGFACFTEAEIGASAATESALAERAEALFGSPAEFEALWQQRERHRALEIYAAFHPFNESGRALEPLLPWVEPLLRPGDAILDLWCRTGWSAEWLAGRFPAQRVIALWEGNRSVLGYRGFRHLLGAGERAANLDVLFVHPEQPLPFRDGAFALVHGHDALHRFRPLPFAAEALRVSDARGAIAFPHLHLLNSEPEPYFDRGCRQLHGRDYRAWLDRIEDGGARRGYVFGEASLFRGGSPAALEDDHDTGDHNGLVLILPDGVRTPAIPSVPAERRFVPSPLFRFDPGGGRARVAPALHAGAVGDLLARHAVYRQRLPQGPVALDEAQMLALLLAAGGASESRIATRLGDPQRASAALDWLCRHEILLAAAVGPAGHRLQRFHSLQGGPGDLLPPQWSLDDDRERLRRDAGPPLTGAEIAQLAQAWSAAMRSRNLPPGSGIDVQLSPEPLLVLVAALAALQGYDIRFTPPGAPAAGALCLHDDEARAEPPGIGLALGLDGAADSLLGAWAGLPAGDPAALPQGPATTRIALPVAGGEDLHCTLGELLDGLQALRLQREPGMPSLEATTTLGALLEALHALCVEGDPAAD